MAGIKMTFRWHILITTIMDNTWEGVVPEAIYVGVYVWAAMMEANQKLPYEKRAEITTKNGLLVLGVPVMLDKDLEPYDMEVVMPQGTPYAVKHYFSGIWTEKEPEQTTGGVAEMKQVCDTENEEGNQ